MNKYLEQLVLLSKIDQEIDSYEPKIDSINKTLKDAELKIEKINADLENYTYEILWKKFKFSHKRWYNLL